MIKSWATSKTKKLYESGKSSFRGLDVRMAERRLALLDEVERLNELSQLKSMGLHKLKGDRKGQWAITINGPWRLCFRFANGHAFDVEIVDYHKG